MNKEEIKRKIKSMGNDFIYIYGICITKYRGVYHLSNHYVDESFGNIDDIVDFLLDYSTWEL